RSSSYVGSAENHEGSDPRVTIAPREVPAMLTADENAQLTRVGPGTLMGDLMRQYWIPVVLSSELPAGGRVKRVRILGEDLVALRATSGRVGLLWSSRLHCRARIYS